MLIQDFLLFMSAVIYIDSALDEMVCLCSKATKLFACLEVLGCASNIYFNLVVKILEIF